MTTPLLANDLTLPEALMAFLHNKDGQPIQTARPPALSAAAELGELLLEGHIAIVVEEITAAARSSAGDRAWVGELLDALPDEPVKVRTWIRRRRDALATQQREALDHGVLVKGRGKLLGLFGYDRHEPDPEVRAALLEELDSAQALTVPRAKALAQLLLTPALQRHLRFEVDRVERLTALTKSEEGMPLPGPLFTTMDIAIASAVAVGVLGE